MMMKLKTHQMFSVNVLLLTHTFVNSAFLMISCRICIIFALQNFDRRRLKLILQTSVLLLSFQLKDV